MVTFINYAREDDKIEVVIPEVKYKLKKDSDEFEVIALTQAEFDLLYNLDLSKRPAWDQVRDAFCLSVATGLRYSDIKQLRRDYFNGNFINLKAIKTGHKTTIPINPIARAILDKYKKDS